MSQTTVEMVSYRLKNNISSEQLAATHAQVNDFLRQQPGFMYRSLSEDDKGLLFDVVYWQNMTSAKNAGEKFMTDPAGQSLIALTDETSITMRHMPVLTETPTECSNTD